MPDQQSRAIFYEQKMQLCIVAGMLIATTTAIIAKSIEDSFKHTKDIMEQVGIPDNSKFEIYPADSTFAADTKSSKFQLKK